jgi:hypothetical protein
VLIYAQFIPADAGVGEPMKKFGALDITVHPLAAKVAPFSKPPSPVGEISVVCPQTFPATKRPQIKSRYLNPFIIFFASQDAFM